MAQFPQVPQDLKAPAQAGAEAGKRAEQEAAKEGKEYAAYLAKEHKQADALKKHLTPHEIGLMAEWAKNRQVEDAKDQKIEGVIGDNRKTLYDEAEKTSKVLMLGDKMKAALQNGVIFQANMDIADAYAEHALKLIHLDTPEVRKVLDKQLDHNMPFIKKTFSKFFEEHNTPITPETVKMLLGFKNYSMAFLVDEEGIATPARIEIFAKNVGIKTNDEYLHEVRAGSAAEGHGLPHAAPKKDGHHKG